MLLKNGKHETPCPAIANKETEIEIEYVLNLFSKIYIYTI